MKDALSRSAQAPQRGRPSRFTREQIIDAALDSLAQTGLADFSMHGLARRLEAPVMTIYAYFPNRRALLGAVARHVFDQFEAPEASASTPWRDALRSRMIALDEHLRRYPMTAALIRSEEHDDRSWLGVWLPVGRVLYRQGLRGPKLAFAATWFATQAWGLIMAAMQPSTNSALEEMFALPPQNAADTPLLKEMRQHFKGVDRIRMISFGQEVILDGLARLIDQRDAD